MIRMFVPVHFPRDIPVDPLQVATSLCAYAAVARRISVPLLQWLEVLLSQPWRGYM
jgi:hypothetical protein